jgi:hypothetical protein
LQIILDLDVAIPSFQEFGLRASRPIIIQITTAHQDEADDAAGDARRWRLDWPTAEALGDNERLRRGCDERLRRNGGGR